MKQDFSAIDTINTIHDSLLKDCTIRYKMVFGKWRIVWKKWL